MSAGQGLFHPEMNERRPRAPETTSATSPSMAMPQPLENGRVKPGPGALPADAFDPLKHEDSEQFWYAMDPFFQPVNQDDIRFLRSIPINHAPPHCTDPHLRISAPSLDAAIRPVQRRSQAGRSGGKHNKQFAAKSLAAKGLAAKGLAAKGLARSPPAKHSSDSPLLGPSSYRAGHGSIGEPISLPTAAEMDLQVMSASLNSFPFTHRLVAAMIDVGGASSVASAPHEKGNRSSSGLDTAFWAGIGSEAESRSFQKVLEDRVKFELIERDLIDQKDDDELQTTTRAEQWQLRNVNTLTRTRKVVLCSRVGSELRSQAIRREVKKRNDHVEMAYLERMVRNMKKNKKSRSKYQRLFQRMFGHYKDQDKLNEKSRKATETNTMINGGLLTTGEEKPKSFGKKKKKRSDKVLSASSPVPNSASRIT